MGMFRCVGCRLYLRVNDDLGIIYATKTHNISRIAIIANQRSHNKLLL